MRTEVLEDGVKGLEQLAPVQRLLPAWDGARDRARHRARDGAGPRACCTTRAPQPRHEPGDLRMGRDEVLRAVGVCRMQPAEQLGEGEVGEAAARLPEAVPGEDPDPGRAGLCHQLREHPGLADPRVPRDDDQPARGSLGGRVEPGEAPEAVEVRASPEEGALGCSIEGHVSDYRGDDRHAGPVTGRRQVCCSGAARDGTAPGTSDVGGAAGPGPGEGDDGSPAPCGRRPRRRRRVGCRKGTRWLLREGLLTWSTLVR